MSKSKMSVTQLVTGVGIELSQTLVWTAKKKKGAHRQIGKYRGTLYGTMDYLFI